jgi:XapX domain-containing protein
LIVGFLIGAGCRWFDVPVPSPPTLLGACLVVAITLGYLAIDRLIAP